MTRILIVCEGNVCRSPYVEHLLRHRLAAAGSGPVVESAGTRARAGVAMAERSVLALRAAGIEPGEHRSRDLTEVPALADVALVLTLERAHRAAVLDLAPSLLHRTFTLVEFARIAETAPALTIPAAGGLDALVRAVRTARVPAAAPDTDDVLDPVLGDDSDHEHFRHRVDGPTDTVAALVAAVPA